MPFIYLFHLESAWKKITKMARCGTKEPKIKNKKKICEQNAMTVILFIQHVVKCLQHNCSEIISVVIAMEIRVKIYGCWCSFCMIYCSFFGDILDDVKLNCYYCKQS